MRLLLFNNVTSFRYSFQQFFHTYMQLLSFNQTSYPLRKDVPTPPRNSDIVYTLARVWRRGAGMLLLFPHTDMDHCLL